MLNFLATNWFWIAFIGLMFLMHRSGGGCGAGHSHGHGGSTDASRAATPERAVDLSKKPTR